jgi:integrase
MKRLKTFFRLHGHHDLQIATYFLPARYRKRPEYIPSSDEIYAMAAAGGSSRDRAIILGLWSSGLCVSTFAALNYGDLATELKQGEPYLLIPVYPGMKTRVPDACKGKIAYYTFISPETGEALRSYIRKREETYGHLTSSDPLFQSKWTLWTRTIRPTKRLGRRGIGLIVKMAAKHAGIPQWKFVTPHCLRKAFDSVLRSPTLGGGRMDKGTQEFLMGHILPGSQDPYYVKTSIAYHRSEYAKLNFTSSSNLRKTVDKLIPITELNSRLSEGWMFVAKIDDTQVIIRQGEQR